MKNIFSLFVIFSFLLAGVSPMTAQMSTRGKTSEPMQREKLVKFGTVEALADRRGTYIRWQMAVETDNIGFNVYRINSRGRELVNEFAVLGSKARFGADAVNGEQYSYFDASGKPGDVYVVESLTSTGAKISSDPTSASFTSDLATAAGRKFSDLSKMGARQKTQFAANALSVPPDLATEIESSAAAPDPEMQKAIAAKPGVKLAIKTDGFYRVSRAELATAGFNVNSDPSTWQLYCDGVEQAIEIVGNGDQVEFIAKAKETIESDARYYYLVVGDTAGKRMMTRVSRGTGYTPVTTNYRQTTYVKERLYYISDIINGPAENVWGRLVGSGGTNFNFTLSGIDPLASDANVEVKLQGFSTTTHSVALSINGHALPTASTVGAFPLGSTVTLPASFLVEGTNVLNMVTSVSSDYVLFDSVSVDYSRKYQAAQNQVSFYTTNYRAAKVTGFTTSNLRMFDTTAEGQPIEITDLHVSQDGSGFNIDIPAYRGRQLYAIENSAAKTVSGIEFNTPSTLSQPQHAANLVIIKYQDFTAGSNAWADYRRQQGFAVEVVDVKDIFDEYSYGQPSSAAINSFLKYASTSWQTAPSYVLLVGDASYDAKNYEGLGYLNLVPSMIVNTVYSETPSDEALADFNGDGLAELSIGRIPAQTSQQVTDALTKVQAFEQPALQSFDRGAVFAYDQPIGYDFAAMSLELRNNLPASMPAFMVDRGAPDSHNTLINQINNGRYLVNYSGHGASGTWAAADFFTNDSVPSLTNANAQSIFTMLTCLNGYFINPNADCLAEKLLKAQNGGAVAAWASSGKTTPDVQMVMGNRFFSQLAAGNIARLGDLIRDAKTMIPGGTDVRYSWVLLGDPMLKVHS
ncbi:MAG: C25 family cysteine peptidase [Acidobacteriota bacterium]